MPRQLNRAFTAKLLTWYGINKRDLPWRRTKDPYKIWISEVMLQQTTVKAVLNFYNKWLLLFPNVHSLAGANLEKVLKSWQGLGYYNRAKNLHKAAKIIVDQFNGQLPRSLEEIRKLPGFGPYTAGAVVSIAFNEGIPIVDANIRRVFMRLLAVFGKSEPCLDKTLLPKIKRILPSRHAGDFNQGLMELGALICRSKEPICNLCPVLEFCMAYRKGIQEIIPSPKSVKIVSIKAVIAIIQNKNNKILIQKRPSFGLLADLWEFPGGKIEAFESPQTALKREINEELGSKIRLGKRVYQGHHYYTKYKVDLSAYKAQLKTPLITSSVHRWVRINELGRYPMPSGSAKIAHLILSKGHL